MQHMMRTLVPFLLIGLAGCFSLGRNPPIQRQYVLGGAASAAAPAASAGKLANITIGVRRLQLAPYLAKPFILVRRGPNRITFSEFHRWGEDLNAGITRAVAGYLAAQAPFRAVAVAPWPLGEKLDYLVQLHVLRFEGTAAEAATAGEVRMVAEWEIIRPQDGAVLARGTTDYRGEGWSVDDFAGLVTLLDSGLHTLARELVASLESVIPQTGSATGLVPSAE